ncbi:putative transcriptional regulatory protein [Formosimonas limnophila]|uniref:Probable transcriptional regulatory protein GCM10009007_09050 n=1 Tax=Formosimonas limnophila TaxID=1384487 RepID=A0A8J3CKG8_9BURK|nr:YebC/PmpR family DNA-binding transcriptional regulator [Formosimonas limnophila]GHA70486.1 putative transcriptional regulatory protein [Formosimonas limnophila]
MAGHSKWANIKHKKARADATRGKAWTRIIKELQVAAKTGGGDPTANPRLRLAIDKAKGANMPNDNINRAVARGAGAGEGEDYEEIRYEGYGIGGAALIIDCMTDNKTRTVADVRHALSKHGGNLGTDGSVAFMFDHVGQFLFSPEVSEDTIMNIALENGASDVITDDEGLTEVICDPADFETLKNAFDTAGLIAEEADITMRGQTEIELSGDDAIRMQKILDRLEDLDDVQEVYTNAVLDIE